MPPKRKQSIEEEPAPCIDAQVLSWMRPKDATLLLSTLINNINELHAKSLKRKKSTDTAAPATASAKVLKAAHPTPKSGKQKKQKGGEKKQRAPPKCKLCKVDLKGHVCPHKAQQAVDEVPDTDVALEDEKQDPSPQVSVAKKAAASKPKQVQPPQETPIVSDEDIVIGD